MSTNSSNTKLVIRYYWKHVKKYRLFFFAEAIFLPLTVLVGQIIPTIIVANVLRRLSAGDFVAHQPWQSFGPQIIAYASLIIITGMVMWRVIDKIGWYLEGKIQQDIANEIFNHLANQSADFHANRFSGSLVSYSNRLITSYVRIADTTFYSTLPLVSYIVFASIIMVSRAPIFVALLLLFSTIYLTVATYASKPVRKAGERHADAESSQTGYLADMIGNVMAVKSFSGEEHERKGFYKKTEQTHHELKRSMRAHMKQMYYFGAVSRTTMTVSLIMAIVSVVSFNANIATVFLILSYSSAIVDQLFQFSNSSLRNYNRSVGDAVKMVKILNEKPEIKDPSHPESVKMNRGAIRFNDVIFTHKGANKPIFNGLNIRFKPGEKIGLVGHSGSGKTSLTRILLRFSDIDSGAIEIDGQNIANVAQADLRKAISYVPQEPLLFHRSIAENIAYGRPEASQEEIEAIARKANAEEFIKTLPNGYETLVGERGVKLSGGQRQRIAIARAMIKNAPILILDEATSALDSESEALIQDALWKLMEGRTAIVIAHRLSTIQRMDRIVVLDNGKIVEEGSHKDLIYKKGVYAKLWERQSGGFLEE